MNSITDRQHEIDNILSELDMLAGTYTGDVARDIAHDFRMRRIEKNLTRKQIASKSGVAISNITRFEQKGLVSLKNLIEIAAVIGYLPEIKGLFARQKYSTMQELLQIRENAGKKKAYPKKQDK